jgi:two-component system chemotaxis response regulator CheB
MLRVLVCEDSVPVSQLLTELINADPELQVVGVAGNGREAVELNRKLRPDIITMDARMPVLNGLEATSQIMSELPTPIVLVSEIAETEVELSMAALNAGALTVLPKPHGPGHPAFQRDSENLRHTLKLMAGIKLVRRWLPTTPASAKPTTPEVFSSSTRPRLIAIGSSTGGPSALATLLKGLPATFKLPIVITQHIMPGFGEGLARWLNDTTGRRVVAARSGMVIEPDSAVTIIAPDYCHLVLTPGNHLAFDYRGQVNGVLPSVDVMFASVAQVMGASAIGVLLTGMGKDGAQGLLQLRKAGAYTLAQDEATSVVFGMPKEAIALGATWKVVPLEKMAPEIVNLCYNPQESRLT